MIGKNTGKRIYAVGIAALVAVLVAACSEVEVLDWYAMDEAQRMGYCESIKAQHDGADWRWGNHYQANLRLQANMQRCKSEGYL